MDYGLRLISQPERRVHRQHMWKRPSESVISGLLGEDMLQGILEASMGHHIPIPISCIPQVKVHQGELYPTIQGAGFSSLSDLISEATNGKRQDYAFNKVGTTGAVGFTNSLWRVGSQPASAAAAAALAGGTHNDNTTAGGLQQTDPTAPDTLHLTTMLSSATVAGQLLLLYDRLWNGLIALSSNATQTCTLTGYPNSTGRYSGTGATGSSRGNFAFVCNEGGATLSAVAHTWTMVYTDDAGTTGQTATALAGISGAIVNRFDHANHYIPLLTGDIGISDIESIACSVNTVAAGAPTIVLAHPLAFCPQLAANVPFILDGINSAFNLVEILTDACLALAELQKSATTATTFTGQVTMVAG
jgi:hypothetical protein